MGKPHGSSKTRTCGRCRKRETVPDRCRTGISPSPAGRELARKTGALHPSHRGHPRCKGAAARSSTPGRPSSWATAESRYVAIRRVRSSGEPDWHDLRAGRARQPPTLSGGVPRLGPRARTPVACIRVHASPFRPRTPSTTRSWWGTVAPGTAEHPCRLGRVRFVSDHTDKRRLTPPRRRREER